MAMLCKLVLWSCFVALTVAADDFKDFQQLMNIIHKPRVLERHKQHRKQTAGQPTVTGFKYSNCGKSTDPIQVSALSLAPDPLVIPGNITVRVKAAVKKTLTAPIKVDLTIKKKVLFWIEVPCLDGVGSCTYDDACALLTQIKCPPEFKKYHISCECPIKANAYTLPPTEIEIPKISIPSVLEDGDYQVKAKLSTHGQELGCLFIELSLKKG